MTVFTIIEVQFDSERKNYCLLTEYKIKRMEMISIFSILCLILEHAEFSYTITTKERLEMIEYDYRLIPMNDTVEGIQNISFHLFVPGEVK